MRRLQPEGAPAPAHRSSIVFSVLFLWLVLAGLASAPLHGSIPRDQPHDVASLALTEGTPTAERVASAFSPARLELGISEEDAAILRRVLVRQNPWSAFDPLGLSEANLEGVKAILSGVNYVCDLFAEKLDTYIADPISKKFTGLTARQLQDKVVGEVEEKVPGGQRTVDAVEILLDLRKGRLPDIKDLRRSSRKVDDIAEEVAESGGNMKTAKKTTLEQNKKVGAEHEGKVGEKVKGEQTDVKGQVTLETESGTRTKIDFAGKKAGEPKLTEAKGSETARLTPKQKKGFPEIEQTGATVRGKNGGDAFPPGTKIPPTKVDIVRPKDL